MTSKRFTNKTVLITGASSGIGVATALAFAREGASLMLAARREARLAEVGAACRALGVSCEWQVTDVRDRAQAQRLADRTFKAFGRVDVLVNNAGLGIRGLFHEQKWEDIERVLRTNLEGAMAVTHAVLPRMIETQSATSKGPLVLRSTKFLLAKGSKESSPFDGGSQGGGSIVNVSSVIGKRGVLFYAPYCASKFGMDGWSESLRLELRAYGLHVCHFCPGYTTTEFQRVAIGLRGDDPAGAVTDRRYLGQMSAEAVAARLVRAVVHRRREVILSWPGRIVVELNRWFPRLTDRLVGWSGRRGNRP